MKISRIVDLHADAGWRVFSFLKIETDAGLIGWSEYNESYGSKGLTVVIMKLAEMLIGQDPRPVELITANLYARTRQAPGGIIQQAIAAIENALVDVKAKALGVPVCEMLGGPVRDRLRLYWSHCGTYRLHHAEKMGLPPIRTLDDIRKLGEHVRERGFTALKTNIFLFDGGIPELYMPGFGRSPGGPELNPSVRVEEALDKQLAGFREGAGRGVRMGQRGAGGSVRLFSADGLTSVFAIQDIRRVQAADFRLNIGSIETPLASCESLFGRRQFKGGFNYPMHD
jgi:galactonate dehydratase